MTDLRVPVRIRQALNIERGLNDGLVLPVIPVLVDIAAVNVDLETTSFWVGFAARQIGAAFLSGRQLGMPEGA